MTAAFRAVGLGWQPAERLPSHTAAEPGISGSFERVNRGGATVAGDHWPGVAVMSVTRVSQGAR